MFHADIAASGRLRVALEQSVARAAVSDEFSLDYQPIYRIADRRPVAVEALLRWRHPELGPVAPDDFEPFLEESGLIVEIGRMVLRMALGQLSEWRRRGLPGLRMAVNLSASQWMRPKLLGEIRQALGDTGLPGEALELELTESLLMSNPEPAIRTLTQLKTLGVTIAVDDLGTGYSSLAYLKRLPIDKLKIDREFIGDLLHDPDDATIVEMIIAMARALGIRATAEFGTYDSIPATDAEHTPIQTWVRAPPSFDRSKKYRSFMLLHGRPHKGIHNGMAFRCPVQVFGSWGDIAAWPQSHGSSG